MRTRRKVEHINIALNLEESPYTTGLEDIQFIHHSIPQVNLDEVDLGVSFLDKELSSPLIINAITGGVAEALGINRDLSEVAGELGIGIAVGSQTIALENDQVMESFKVVREVNPQGLILANISASVDPALAARAVEMIEADGLQLHLNVPQELAMKEGDRNFRDLLDNVARMVACSPVPVIAKEVGFGLSREACQLLFDAGVRVFDVGGRGGTNFIAIEKARGGLLGDDFLSWGIPTAVSIAELKSLNLPITMVASGGIRSGLQAAKAIGLGADLAGVAGHFLRTWFREGRAGLIQEIENFQYQMKCTAVMVGATNLSQLKLAPMVILGSTAHWLSLRGIDARPWAGRSPNE